MVSLHESRFKLRFTTNFKVAPLEQACKIRGMTASRPSVNKEIAASAAAASRN